VGQIDVNASAKSALTSPGSEPNKSVLRLWALPPAASTGFALTSERSAAASRHPRRAAVETLAQEAFSSAMLSAGEVG
jgi:hypothetical protein